MLLTSQNRDSVSQVRFANQNGDVLAADVAHRDSSKRPYPMMRRTALSPRAMTTEPICRSGIESSRQASPEPFGHALPMKPRLWASLVLSRMARG
jgi:hypothetical protein